MLQPYQSMPGQTVNGATRGYPPATSQAMGDMYYGALLHGRSTSVQGNVSPMAGIQAPALFGRKVWTVVTDHIQVTLQTRSYTMYPARLC